MKMSLPTISIDQARDAWNCHFNDEPLDLKGTTFDYVGDPDGARFSDLDAVDLLDQLQAIRFDFPDKPSTQDGGKIDSRIVEPIHQFLSERADVYQLANPGFWRWLSNVACEGSFWRFIMWRLNSEQQINWGITSPTTLIEVYLYRAWLRGEKMYDEALADPYHYAKLGAADVWRSHILRQDFGADREFVKAFLDTIYDEDSKTIVTTAELRKVLIPAIRAWTSNASFAHLSYEECKQVISDLRRETS